MKKHTKALVFLLIAILSFFILSRHQKQVARRQEEARKTAAEAGAINTGTLSYADSLTRIDPDPSHILLGGGGRPWLLGTPYPTQGEVELVIGKPSSIDSAGTRIWFYRPVPRINASGATVYDEPSKLLELTFDQDDGRLRRMTIHKEGETTVGRDGRSYEKHWTYSVPTVPNSNK
ncbi:MAG TPA: hypothetical protein VGQ12_08250 [Candidatus Angelobacter sp.]|jgi:hypothetical protein|nr:hypothetical protein [Candidatus Angelobacter sp.]